MTEIKIINDNGIEVVAQEITIVEVKANRESVEQLKQEIEQCKVEVEQKTAKITELENELAKQQAIIVKADELKAVEPGETLK